MPLWSESKFMRFAHARLRPWFPCLPNRDGYNKRLRRSADMIAAAGIARPGQTLTIGTGERGVDAL